MSYTNTNIHRLVLGEHYGPGCKDDVLWPENVRVADGEEKRIEGAADDECDWGEQRIEGAADDECDDSDVDVEGGEGAEGKEGNESQARLLKIVRDEFHEIRTRPIASGEEDGEFKRRTEEEAHAYKYSAIG